MDGKDAAGPDPARQILVVPGERPGRDRQPGYGRFAGRGPDDRERGERPDRTPAIGWLARLGQIGLDDFLARPLPGVADRHHDVEILSLVHRAGAVQRLVSPARIPEAVPER